MIKTTYTCDRCKDSVDPNHLYLIKLSATPVQSSSSFEMTPRCGNGHWCIKCMENLDWFDRRALSAVVPPRALCLEDLIRELITDVLSNQS